MYDIVCTGEQGGPLGRLEDVGVFPSYFMRPVRGCVGPEDRRPVGGAGAAVFFGGGRGGLVMFMCQ